MTERDALHLRLQRAAHDDVEPPRGRQLLLAADGMYLEAAEVLDGDAQGVSLMVRRFDAIQKGLGAARENGQRVGGDEVVDTCRPT